MSERDPNFNPETATPADYADKLTIEFGGISHPTLTLPETISLFGNVSNRLDELRLYLLNPQRAYNHYIGILREHYGAVMWNIINHAIRPLGTLHPHRGGVVYSNDREAAFQKLDIDLQKGISPSTANSVHGFGHYILLKHLREPENIPHPVFEAFGNWHAAISSDETARRIDPAHTPITSYKFVYGPFKENVFFNNPLNGVSVVGSALNNASSEYFKYLDSTSPNKN